MRVTARGTFEERRAGGRSRPQMGKDEQGNTDCPAYSGDGEDNELTPLDQSTRNSQEGFSPPAGGLKRAIRGPTMGNRRTLSAESDTAAEGPWRSTRL